MNKLIRKLEFWRLRQIVFTRKLTKKEVERLHELQTITRLLTFF